MRFSKARDSNLCDEEKGKARPSLLTHPAAFRETAHRRWRRQASTLARAVLDDVRRNLRGSKQILAFGFVRCHDDDDLDSGLVQQGPP